MSAAPHIRAPRRDDLEEVVALLRLCDVAEYGVPDTTAEDVAADWELHDFDMATDAWVTDGDDGRLTAYAYAGDQLRNGKLEGDVFVDPRSGWGELGGALLDRVEQRAAQLAATRAYPEAELRVFAAEVNHGKRDLLAARGFTARRRVYRLEIDLSQGFAQAHAPAGFALRAFRPGADERAMYDTMMAAFSDVTPSEEPFEAWRTRLQGHGDFDAAFWFIAWEVSRPVGGLIAYDHGDTGWVKGLGVVPSRRRRGIGGALLSTALSAFRARGQSRVGLGVDAEADAAPRLYERVGLRPTQTYDLFAKRIG